ncbi:MAG: restriction endonuclease subunit S [Candidatus Eremiobacterota bacterium]
MMKLNKDKWEIVKFEKIVSNISERVEPNNTNLDKYIGLEHLDSGNSKIKRFGTPKEVIGTKLKIYKGDIIFGKRRAYQRKAAVVDFNAICSAHSMVLRANENVIVKDYLLCFIHSDMFMNRAIEISEGSLSPTIKWKTLAKQEFPLPYIEEQKIIASLFKSIEITIEQLELQEKNLKLLRKNLINKLSKKSFHFGNLIEKSKCKEFSIGEVANEIPDRTDNPSTSGFEKFVGLEDFESGELNIQKYSSTEKLVSAMKLFKSGDILFARRNAYLKRASLVDFDGVCSGDAIVMRAIKTIIEPLYLVLIMNTDEFWDFAISNAAGTMSKRVKWRDLATYIFNLPDLNTQKNILEIFQQLQTTQEQLKQQKTTLKTLKQKLLNEVLG